MTDVFHLLSLPTYSYGGYGLLAREYLRLSHSSPSSFLSWLISTSPQGDDTLTPSIMRLTEIWPLSLSWPLSVALESSDYCKPSGSANVPSTSKLPLLIDTSICELPCHLHHIFRTPLKSVLQEFQAVQGDSKVPQYANPPNCVSGAVGIDCMLGKPPLRRQ